MQMKLPAGAEWILRKLEQNGYEAYLVGGCVRDSLLGTAPHDWDIATIAKPQEILHCFSDARTIDAGIRHGTVGIVSQDGLYEVTTFRTDGEYTNHRHPKQVRFVNNLLEDLSRRDFTINAMAFHPARGLIDPFGGRRDLENRHIRCVGEARARYEEDALRILRALRFASVLDFNLGEETASQAKSCRKLLSFIAQERIYSEFIRMLCGQGVRKILQAFPEILSVFLPEFTATYGFCQHSPYHIYDVWEHTLKVVEGVSPQPALRLAALFHDAAKPQCFTLDNKQRGHFYGHPQRSAILARQALERLRVDGKTIREVSRLVEAHEMEIVPKESSVRRALSNMGTEQMFWELLELQRADAQAKAPKARQEQEERIVQVKAIARKVIEEKQCFSRQMLAVNGTDIKRLGIEGKRIGKALSFLLEQVIEGTLTNHRVDLLRAVEKWNSESKNNCR